MFKLFQGKSKVKEGKQTQPAADKKKESPLAAFSGAWKKLNKMDRKQAYTWGAVAVVAIIGLLILASASSTDQEDFSDLETRGYDLANMPFSSDEAEQYLLASKYPDMQKGNGGAGLYSAAEKEARQEEDAEQAEEQAASAGDDYSSGYYGGGYSGGSRGGRGRTQVGSLSSAGLKSASGSGISGKFGPSGDFSNFRSQNKGNDKAPKGPGSGNARTALRQTAVASRAAAGLKNDKLLNAKKALMGGNVQGSGAFMDDSGAVNLGEAKGLNLDTDAPVSSADLSGLNDALADARDKGQQEAQQEDEDNFWKEFGRELLKQVVQAGINLGTSALQMYTQNAMADARQINALTYQADMNSAQTAFDAIPKTIDGKPNPALPDLSDYGNDVLKWYKTQPGYTSSHKTNRGNASVSVKTGNEFIIGGSSNASNSQKSSGGNE